MSSEIGESLRPVSKGNKQGVVFVALSKEGVLALFQHTDDLEWTAFHCDDRSDNVCVVREKSFRHIRADYDHLTFVRVVRLSDEPSFSYRGVRDFGVVGGHAHEIPLPVFLVLVGEGVVESPQKNDVGDLLNRRGLLQDCLPVFLV